MANVKKTAKTKRVKRTKTSSAKVHAERARFSSRRGLSDRDKKIFKISRRVIVGAQSIPPPSPAPWQPHICSLHL